ncbi:MAG: SHOCT domain-containing protein [Nitrososphaerota archaeon]|nr:SHOCT domain-containing protein [Nitrososphaerota archaeon]
MIVLAATTMISGRGLWSKSTSERSDSAFQIIRERYAKGEITKEQFEQMTKDLGR